MKAGDLGVFALIAIVVAGGFWYFTTGKTTAVVSSGGSQATSNNGVDVYGYAVTCSASAYDALGKMRPLVNAEIWGADGKNYVGETSVAGALTSLSSAMPNNFNGFIYIGNDNYVSSTDRGNEVYYTKQPVSWTNHAGTIAFSDIKTYNESTATFTGYDDGAVESTLNVSIGAGETYTKAKLDVQAGSKIYLGNPALDHPLAICFNASGTSGVGGSIGDWDAIRPANYYATIPVPKFLKSVNVIGGECYVLNTQALKDYEHYSFDLVIDPSGTVNPGEAATVHALLLDKTYCKNDFNNDGQQEWGECWGYDNPSGTSTDVGLDTLNSGFKIIGFT